MGGGGTDVDGCGELVEKTNDVVTSVDVFW